MDKQSKNDIEKAFVIAVRQALDEKGTKQNKLAEHVGITPQYLSKILRGQRIGTEYVRRRIAQYLGLNYDLIVRNAYLIAKAGEIKEQAESLGSAPGSQLPIFSQLADEFCLVPRFLVTEQGDIGPEQIKGVVAFRRDWLVDEMGLSEKTAATLEVAEDSMSPLLEEGDLVLISLNDSQEINTGGVFALGVDKHIQIKRLHVMPGRIMATSDNPQYPSFDLTPDIRIIGRVVWFARTL